MPYLYIGFSAAEKAIDISHFDLTKRANLWILKGRVGLSSSCIWGHMTGTICEGNNSHYPRDIGDFNRCLLLLEAVPEWNPRMSEMSAHGPVWAALAEQWNNLKELFIEEAGINFSLSSSAPKTSALLRQIIHQTPLKNLSEMLVPA